MESRVKRYKKYFFFGVIAVITIGIAIGITTWQLWPAEKIEHTFDQGNITKG